MRPLAACTSITNDSDCVQALHTLVKGKLKSEYSVTYKTSKKQNGNGHKFPATPGRQRSASAGPPLKHNTSRNVPKRPTVFGRPLRDLCPTTFVLQAENSDEIEKYEVTIPHFLSSMMKYLIRPECLNADGIFRKAGSTARQKKLREEIEIAETFDCTSLEGLNLCLSALDCASILKQWLRELPEPLIPTRLHEVFLKCDSISNSEDRIDAILLCTLLLPSLHSASLACLVRFLSRVASEHSSNQMDSKNLAIVFTPGFFHATGDEMAKGAPNTGQETGTYNQKMRIVETLISHSSKVGMVEETMYSILGDTAACNFISQPENAVDGLDSEIGGDFAGPSARRRKKKKRRSGSLSRVLTAFKQAISRSATPAGSRCTSTTNIASSSENLNGTTEKCTSSTNLSTSEFFRTPNMTPITPFVIPRIGIDSEKTEGKRKGAQVDQLSFNSKQRKGANTNITPLGPPVSRGRSITLKGRFKSKKCTGAGTELDKSGRSMKCSNELYSNRVSKETMDYTGSTNTPLPCKPTFSNIMRPVTFPTSNTPGTPNSFGVPSAVQDLSGIGSSEEFSDTENNSPLNLKSLRGKTNTFSNNLVERTASLTSVKKYSQSRNGPSYDDSAALDRNKLCSDSCQPGITIASPDFVHHRKSKARYESQSPMESAKSSRSSISSSGSTTSTRSRVSLKSTASTRSIRKSNGTNAMKKPRSPSERKIGLVRRRSQEMARKSSIRESQRDLELSRNRQNLMKMQCSEGKSPGPLHRGKPNTFNVRPSPLKVISGKKSTGSPSYRIKMSFKEGQIQNPRVIPKTKDSTSLQKRAPGDSVTNLKQDISSIIEKSFGSGNDQSTSQISAGKANSSDNDFSRDDTHSIVGHGMDSLSINNPTCESYSEINDITSKFSSVNMHLGAGKKPSSLKMEWLGIKGPFSKMENAHTLRRQSSAFECRLPSAIAAQEKAKRAEQNKDTLRRQSSAFEIGKKNNRRKLIGSIPSWKDTIEEPIYENFERPNQSVTRASLRLKNSSVKDLVQKLEKVDIPLTLDAPIPLVGTNNSSQNKRMSLSTSSLPNPMRSAQNDPIIQTFLKPRSTNDTDEPILDDFKGSVSSIDCKDSTGESYDSNEALDEFDFEQGGGIEQWMDAKEFFEKTPGPPKNIMIHPRLEESIISSASGCKRSSIIRIRTEKKGLVSKSVENFTKPAMLPPSIIPRTPGKPPAITRMSTANTPITSRRLSAGMGITGRTLSIAAKNSLASEIVPITPPTSMGVAGAAARRQSIGVRTPNQTISHKETTSALMDSVPCQNSKFSGGTKNSPSLSYPCKINEARSLRISSPKLKQTTHQNTDVTKSTDSNKKPTTEPQTKPFASSLALRNSTSSGIRQNSGVSRKSKRIEERRHLTIGYAGEKVRSPLKERQNIMVTVQRSKSAQTPAKGAKVTPRNGHSNKIKSRRKQFKDSPYTENSPYSENTFNVHRSLSLRAPQTVIEIPSSLKETIYDVTTPKSDKVKRNLSDRVITPGRGGKREAAPYIKTALLSDGKTRTPVPKTISGTSHHSRLHQIIQQDGASMSSKRSNNTWKQYPASSLNSYHIGASPKLRKSPR